MAQPAQDFRLTITPLKPADLPSEAVILAAADAVLENSAAWKQGKTFHKTVRTFHHAREAGDGAAWHARVSEHPEGEVSFDRMWDKLGRDKPENEKQFIPEIKKVTKIKDVSPTAAIWSMYYTFAPPVSPRVFTVLQVTRLDSTAPRSGTIVSIPIDLSDDPELAALEEKGAVRGRYTSVERILELAADGDKGGKTEWRMATSSTPGGSIPTFVVETTMAGKVAQDVPHFLKWVQGAA
ncbi:hypothetical protein BD779DRAFT_196192 [Infundibulicybe gibba]|nr:hypothetical protein BD779DRAFT_196192 [Infundibulicybe gibba]